ncbi:TerC family protein [Samsonia erythrinae]|uniref:Putative tellurium resistance membrane protein TerC n=1 Tax=Samsonia erythrinae TaxID=160434 RepID=A0A4R3VPF3_9GAMM|nr:TerC family protein [Samsonia erythrinae]TCV08945.1 putative tellurium resistance membrane protein TerC [Samsonia erythrinae]
MEWIADPTIWAGLATLVVLELVLGIDNLIFIAILAEKLPKEQRDKARVVGLLLALVMRLILLSSISWLVSLTTPLFTLLGHTFSARDVIMLVGGLFLLFKATMELNERLEGKDEEQHAQRSGARFWPVVAQIVVLDAIFSLDSVITAVGMTDHLLVMMSAVTIAIFLMLLASKPLTRFVAEHPTIVILCLSFLLMIGFSLVADAFGYHIPKGYLYAAIGFSVLIEMLNQVSLFNRRRFLSSIPLRQRTAEAVLRILRGNHEEAELDNQTSSMIADNTKAGQEVFNLQERRMIKRVLGLAQRTISSIMTSRHDIEPVELDIKQDELAQWLKTNPHSRLVITDSNASDEPLGIVHVADLLQQQLNSEPFNLRALIRQPLVFPEQLSLLQALEQFREGRTHFAFVVDEFGSMEGIITLSDVMETIAGNLPREGEDRDARHSIQQNNDGSWTVNGYIPLEDLTMYVPLKLDEKREYYTLAGLLMEHAQRIPQVGDTVSIDDYDFTILAVESHRIVEVRITPNHNSSSDFEV